MIGDDQFERLTPARDLDVRLRPSIQLSYGCFGVHLADWRCVGNGPAGAGEGLRARPERQRSRVRIVSGAPERHMPGVPGLWRRSGYCHNLALQLIVDQRGGLARLADAGGRARHDLERSRD